MIRTQFFKKKFKSLTAQEISDITGAQIVGNANLDRKFDDVSTLDKADEHHISFLNSGQYFSNFQVSKAGCCLVEEKYASKAPEGMTILTHKNPYFAYAKLAKGLYEEKEVEYVEATSVHPTASIGQGTKIAPTAYVGKNVTIGSNCFIGPNASIMDNCTIGDNCVINAGAVISFAVIGNKCTIFNGATIGQDGFGFAHDNGVNHKILQLGIVKIGHDVEIGANSCIDRGAIENTIISDGVKLDNLVQVGHNVTIGKGSVIAGCTALAGSCTIGNYVQIGGNSSISGHITIGDGAKIAGMSGVARDVDVMQAMAGIPAVPIRDWHKANSKLAKLIKPAS